ncbi:MAG: enoyl-CoA hydratase/isomerase family protein [Nannocystaceae bacterium]|nr:enoyl-CoA hydratase/isomerase family protein [Nannocystaceae bacterium]
MTTEKTRNGMATLAFDDATGVATITLAMEGKVNKINDDFGATMQEAMAWVKARTGLRGLVIASGHKDFCVGADIDRLYKERSAATMATRLRELNGLYRAIETLGVPVVAALTGSALGGGYELALACHRRIALDDAKVQVGLPEVNLGVIPGAGGTQRLPRLIGIQAALEHIAQGKIVRAPKAVKIGMVDELAATPAELQQKAVAWIHANKSFKQPWDRNAPIPGPQPGSPEARQIFMAASAMLRKKTAGVFPGPELAISSVQEGLPLVFDRAIEIESRYFTQLAISDQAKDMIRTLWFHRTAAEKHEGLPKVEDANIRKVGILGAGMMGAGLAFVSAQAGYTVVLKDVKEEQLGKARAHCQAQAAELKHLGAAGQQAILDRISYTLSADDLAGCDLIIEAVFENLELKHAVTKEAEPKLAKGGVWASNTSAIPIGDLAKVSTAPQNFIGLHFFSPVEKMQLVEVITTETTSSETLARSLAYTRAIKKLPIVVGDGYAFYTTRVFSAYILEGAQLVAEGHDPVLIEWASRKAGMVVPPLQVFDEVTLTLGVKGFKQSRAYGKTNELPAFALVEAMVEKHGRAGKAAGKGFYDYGGDGRTLWPGLAQLAVGKPAPENTGVEVIARRLLTLQALEAARCVAEGIVKNPRDAEVGAIFGVGFAPNTGGPLSYIDRRGLVQFVADCDALAKVCGARFEPPQLLRDMAKSGKTFFERV